MSDNNNNAKTMYEAVPAAAELNKVPGFDPLKFLRRAGDSMKLDLPYQKCYPIFQKLKKRGPAVEVHRPIPAGDFSQTGPQSRW